MNFYQLFYGPNRPPGQNSSGFDHPEFNKLYEEIRFMENGPKRFEKFERMAQILQEEVPAILDYRPLVSGLIQKWVKNFKRNMMVSKPFKYFNVDVETQQTMLKKKS